MSGEEKLRRIRREEENIQAAGELIRRKRALGLQRFRVDVFGVAYLWGCTANAVRCAESDGKIHRVQNMRDRRVLFEMDEVERLV